MVAMVVAPLASHAQSRANGRQVDAFFNGIELDRQLAEQYSAPTPAPVPAMAPAAAAPKLDEAAMAKLELEIDQALAEDEDAADAEDRTVIAETPPTLLQTALLVLSGLGLLAFAGVVLTWALRELRKDEKQRRRSYRRRVKRRTTAPETVAAAH
jgi:hypothetical protein